MIHSLLVTQPEHACDAGHYREPQNRAEVVDQLVDVIGQQHQQRHQTLESSNSTRLVRDFLAGFKSVDLP